MSDETQSFKATTTTCYWYPSDNFGDAMNPWLISKISQGKLTPTWSYEPTYLCIGSILGFRPTIHDCIVWGSGMMFRNDILGKPQQVLAVRGPITAQRFRELGYSSTNIYGDPSLLAPLLYQPKKDHTINYQLGIVPHHAEYEQVKEAFQAITDPELAQQILVIDLMQPTERVIDQMISCQRLAASSLHGLIVPQAYGKPTAWVKLTDKISGDGTKYQDYLQSVQLAKQVTCQSVLDFDFRHLLTIAQEQARTIDPIVLQSLQQGLWETCPFRGK